MSDQQVSSDGLGDDHRTLPLQHQQQMQQQQLSPSSNPSMRVKVTNLVVDGMFPFSKAAAASASTGPATGPSTSTSKGTPDATASLKMGITKRVKFKSGPARQPPPLMQDNHETSTSKEPLHLRSLPLLAAPLTTSPSLDDEDSSYDQASTPRSTSATAMDNSSKRADRGIRWPRMDPASFLRSSTNSSTREREAMDASSSSQASWNVTIIPKGTDKVDDKNTESTELWFEKYMPDSVIRFRTLCGNIVLNSTFQIVMVVLIVINSIFMGIATFDFVDNNPQMRHIFEHIDRGFLIAFTVELALQFGYWGYQLFYDGWLLFDFFIVVSSWLLEGVQVFRSMRIFRAFRLVVRIPILKSLVHAAFHVFPRIGAIVALFSLIIYIFAVTATILYGDIYKRGITDTDYFGTLFLSLFTLFQFITMDNWSDVVRAVMAVDPSAKYIFGLFITLSGFILYSLVVAVVCDSFLVVESRIRAELKEKAKLDRLRRKALLRSKAKKRKNIFVDDDASGRDSDDDSHSDNSNRKRESFGSQVSFSSGRPSLSQLSFLKRPKYKPDLFPSSAGQTPSRAAQRSRGQSPPPPPSPTSPATRLFLKGVFSHGDDPSSQEPPAHGDSTGVFHPNLTRRHRRSVQQQQPLEDASSGTAKSNASVDRRSDNQNPRRNNTDVTIALDEDEDSVGREPMPSRKSQAITKSLAIGDLERKIRETSKKKKRPVPHRIKRVQYRLNKLSKTQKRILSTLDDLCKDMESRNIQMDQDALNDDDDDDE